MLKFENPQDLQVKCALLLGVFLVASVSFILAPKSPSLKHNNETQVTRAVKLNTTPQHLDIFTSHQMEIVHTYCTETDSFHNKITMAELDHQGLIFATHIKPYLTTFTHWYDDQDSNQLTKWGGPKVDQELCLRQLEQLNDRIDKQYAKRSNSKDINLSQLLDTYGWLSTGAFLGTTDWPGEYNECLRLKIESNDGPIATRYCSGAFKRHKWPKNGRLNQLLSQRCGICLPKSCDSTSYGNKFELIEKLVKSKARQLDDDDIYLDNLYCLPDEQSPLRLWYYSSKTVAFVGGVMLWIALLAVATFRYRSLGKKSLPDQNNRIVNLYKSLSLTENVKSLLRTTSLKKEATKKERKVVDLDVVEGIKVISICYVITGHVLLGFTKLIVNGREKGTFNLDNLTFISGNCLPALTVNVFLSITGILTAYLMFKHSKPIKLITSPLQWVVFVALRYFRIMPVYLLVVMYLKYLAKYTGSGPFWDYGTTSLSPRSMCEQEPWFYTLLFAANFKNPMKACVPSAWYVANDFQFLLVTPVFLALLEKRPKLGKLVIICVMVISYIITFARIATLGADLRPLSRFMPHGFTTYMYFLSDTYTQPHYRIPAFLSGILMGYTLYKYEQAKLLEISSFETVEGDKKVEEETKRKVDWPGWMKRYGSILFPITVVSSFGLPFIEIWTQFSKSFSPVAVAIFLPTYHLMFAVSAGFFILLVSTGHSNQSVKNFLASCTWKPLSRLNLCAMLINMEVINYFTQTSTHLLYFDFKIVAALNLFAIVMSYSIAAAVCAVFELPLQKLINIYLVGPLIGKSQEKHTG